MSSGHLASAGLDVWEEEPPATDHPLLHLDTVLASPHTAGVTHESRRLMGTYAAQGIIDVIAGKRPERLVNPDVWPAYCARFEVIMGFQPAS